MDITGFTDDQLAIIYRSVHFESKDYDSIDSNGYLGDATRDILEKITEYKKEIADPFYVSDYISKAP